MRYPDFFGGAWILQPDPIDFRNYLLTNIYDDDNDFTARSGELTVERPFRRTVQGGAAAELTERVSAGTPPLSG